MGDGDHNPRKYEGVVRVCFDPLKCYILSFKTVVGYSASFSSRRTKDLCEKMEGITNFSTRLKQFHGLT